MQKSLLQFYDRGDISLLKQFLQHIPIFNQIQGYLSSSLYNELLQIIQIHQLQFGVPYDIDCNTTYYFMTSGVIMTKIQRIQTFGRPNKLRKSLKMTFNQALQTRQKTIDFICQKQKQKDHYQLKKQAQKTKAITVNQLYNQHLLFNSKKSQNLSQQFMMNEDKKSIIIVIDNAKISNQIHQILNEKHNQKFKFITSTPILKCIPKYIVQANLYKFKFLKIHFDNYLFRFNYSNPLRQDSIIFLIQGQVQVTCNNFNNNLQQFKDQIRPMNSYLIKSPVIFGAQHSTNIISAKSATQICIAYYIDKKQVLEMLKKSLQNKQKNNDMEEQIKKIMKKINPNYQKGTSRSNNGNLLNQTMQYNASKNTTPRNTIHQEKNRQSQTFYRSDRCSTISSKDEVKESSFSIFKPKSNNKNCINQFKINEKKKFRIKQHFSNFLNDRFAQFAQKKTQFLNKKCQNQDNTLYQIKSLIKKPPQMNTINQKLKLQRLQRIIRCKQNIQLSKQNNITSMNLRKYQQFQQIKQMTKIKRKLQFQIHKKQLKNKLQKFYIPSSKGFNKFVSLALSTIQTT